MCEKLYKTALVCAVQKLVDSTGQCAVPLGVYTAVQHGPSSLMAVPNVWFERQLAFDMAISSIGRHTRGVCASNHPFNLVEIQQQETPQLPFHSLPVCTFCETVDKPLRHRPGVICGSASGALLTTAGQHSAVHGCRDWVLTSDAMQELPSLWHQLLCNHAAVAAYRGKFTLLFPRGPDLY
jgi:hypothetical protein